MEEDRPILESIQTGVKLAHTDGLMAVGEPRIKSFMDGYLARMSGETLTSKAIEPWTQVAGAVL